MGERLITSRSEPVFGGVYKLVAIEDDEGTSSPRSRSVRTPQDHHPPFQKGLPNLLPGHRQGGGRLICVHDEEIDFTHPLELFDPAATWKRKVYTNIEARELLVPIFRGGELVYQVPELQTSRAYCQRQVDACGMRSSALKTLTITTWTCPRSCGTANPSC